ncbi:MAG: hypothetical protein M4579_007387 [Chaenotheca gracillima]|nr:MAG: hypothetical protein M4579_007387 [Chaenotheca gracillima]
MASQHSVSTERTFPPITEDLLRQSERIGPDAANIYRIDRTTVVKIGEHVRMAEAAAMRLVREKTSVPVPQVFKAYMEAESNRGCIIMEYIEDAQHLDEAWESCDDTQKKSLLAQLSKHFQEMRRVSSRVIGSVDGTYCEDQFFSDDPTAYGPFNSVDDFHQGLKDALRKRAPTSWTEMVCRFIDLLPSQTEIALTHGDLAPRNILVRDARIVAILDWEMAGFYPAYWEYVKTYCWPEWDSTWVQDGIIDEILQPYTTELASLLHAREIIW